MVEVSNDFHIFANIKITYIDIAMGIFDRFRHKQKNVKRASQIASETAWRNDSLVVRLGGEKERPSFIKDTLYGMKVTIGAHCGELKYVPLRELERRFALPFEGRNYMSGSRKTVFYLEEKHDAVINGFFAQYHEQVCTMFAQLGYTFIYLPKEVEKIAHMYKVDYAAIDVEWNAATLLEMLHCDNVERIGHALVEFDETGLFYDEGETEERGGMMRGMRLVVEDEEQLFEQLMAYWGSLMPHPHVEVCVKNVRYDIPNPNSKEFVNSSLLEEDLDSEESANIVGETFASAKEVLEERCYCIRDESYCENRSLLKEIGKRTLAETVDDGSASDVMPENKPDVLGFDYGSKESEQLSDVDQKMLCEIEERMVLLLQHGVKAEVIKGILSRMVKKSHLEVTADARILLTDYGKEVSMLPIDKAVYIFYLRHPEGISIKSLTDHKEELMMLYARVLGKTKLADKQKASVERLCDPWDNSINEKLSRIRKSFCAEVHESVADNYVIQGARGGIRSITLDEELIELGDWGR